MGIRRTAQRVLVLTVLAALTLALALPVSAQDAAPSGVLFENVEVWDGTGADARRTSVLVLDGRIAGVGDSLVIPEGADVDVIDGRGKSLTPGLIAPEFTGGMSGGANEASSEITPGFESASTVDPHHRVFERMIAKGVTSACIPPGTANVVAGWGCVVRPGWTDPDDFIAQRRVALEIILGRDPAAGNQRVFGPPGSFLTRRPTTRMGVVWLLRKSFADAARFARTGEVGDMIKEDGDYEPHELATLAAAAAGEIDVRVTAFPAHDVDSAFRLGRSFGFAERITIVGGLEAWKQIDRIAAADCPVILDYRWSIDDWDYGDAGRMRLHTPRLLADAGIPFCLTTLYSTEDGPDLARAAAFAQRHGLSRAEAIRAVTSSAAEILGIAETTGSVAQGKRADLILWDGAPLEPVSRMLAVYSAGVKKAGEGDR